MPFKNVLLMLENVEYWINIPSGQKKVSKASEHEDDDESDSELYVVWETGVQPLSDLQRLIFFIITVIVTVVAVLANVLGLYVNFSRKQRFLFRACLISLAVSDLILTIGTSCVFLSKFMTSQVALWNLGPLACMLIPFSQVMVLLVNSILLVCIAFDRYRALIRIDKGSWEPGKLFCLCCCVLIWGFSAAVSSPMLTISDYTTVYVVPLPDPDEENAVLTYCVGYLCGPDKVEKAYFSFIIFSFVFVLLLITFFWLNSVLAKEVWKRRIDIAVRVSNNENSSTVTTVTTGWRVQEAYVSPEINARRTKRKQRQIRMFKVILVLMAVFFICRIPNWIYMLYKLSNNSKESIDRLLSYSFGLMVMVNCMLNPFLYTFLSETIRLTTFLAGIICGAFSPCTKLCQCKADKSESMKRDSRTSQMKV